MKIKHRTLFALLCIVLVAACYVDAFAQKAAYDNVRLKFGISLDIPSHWTVLPQAAVDNIGLGGESTLNKAGIKDNADIKERLLGVNATPEPVGASIRLNVLSPAPYTQNDLAGMTDADLSELRDVLLKQFQNIGAHSPFKVIDMYAPRIELVNKQRALIVSYRREGVNSPSSWSVVQYKIPFSRGLIELTLSCRESDALIWSPILDHVKDSLRF